MGYTHGTRWTDELIGEELMKQARSLGRMPSARELRLEGLNDLACAIPRNGGYRRWAERLGLGMKVSETTRASKWEEAEMQYFESLGYEVERQTTKAPFDLLVNGHRVDVKISTLNKTGWFQFGCIKKCVDCDFLDLLCIRNGERVARFIVPANAARVVTVSMMPSTLYGKGKYGFWLDKVELLK